MLIPGLLPWRLRCTRAHVRGAYSLRWRSLPLKSARTTTKNTGTKNTASAVPVIMPPITPVPMARWLAEPAPLAMHQRQHAEDEGHRGHDDRAEAQVRRLQRRFDHALALRLQVLGELDDQDRVLRRQADDGDQADLEVHVVRHSRAAASPAARPARPAAPPGSPPAGSTSSRTARPGTGTPPGSRSRTGSAPARRRAFPRATGRSIRSRSPAAAAPPAAPSRPSPRRCCSPAPASPEMRIAG